MSGSELRAALGDGVLTNEPLSRHTSFRIGGPADWFFRADSAEALLAAAQAAHRLHLPLTVIGGGSNILVADAGIRGLVVLNRSREYMLQPDEGGTSETLIAASGLSLPWLAGTLARAGVSGFEWAIGVPGTVGGAVVQNAGAWGSETGDRLLWVDWLRPETRGHHGAEEPRIERVEGAALALRYRHSIIKAMPREERPIVLRAAFRLDSAPAERLQAQVAEYNARRTASQPRAASGGSTFSNPPGDYAGRLIEAAGLKGRRVGGAEISTQHANFIVTGPGTRASDVAALVRLAQSEVQRQFGVHLEPEIEMIGAWEPAEFAVSSIQLSEEA